MERIKMKFKKILLLATALFSFTGKASNEWEKVTIPQILIDGPPLNYGSPEEESLYKFKYKTALDIFSKEYPNLPEPKKPSAAAYIRTSPSPYTGQYSDSRDTEQFEKDKINSIRTKIYNELTSQDGYNYPRQDIIDEREKERKANLTQEQQNLEENLKKINESLKKAREEAHKKDEELKDKLFGIKTGEEYNQKYYKNLLILLNERPLSLSFNLNEFVNNLTNKTGSRELFIKELMKSLANNIDVIAPEATTDIEKIETIQKKFKGFFDKNSEAKKVFTQAVIDNAILQAETTGNIEGLADQLNALKVLSLTTEKSKSKKAFTAEFKKDLIPKIEKALNTIDSEELTPDQQDNLTEEITDFNNAVAQAKKPSFLKRLKEKIKAKFTTIENNNITDFAKENADKPTLLAEILKQAIKEETKVNKLKNKENQETSKDIVRRITKDLFTGLEQAAKEPNGKSFNELGADLFKAILSNNSLRNELSKAGIKNDEDIKNLVKIHIKHRISNPIAQVTEADGEATREAQEGVAAAHDTTVGDTGSRNGQRRAKGNGKGSGDKNSPADSQGSSAKTSKDGLDSGEKETPEEREEEEEEEAKRRAAAQGGDSGGDYDGPAE
jgi:hypothetical protein